MERKDAFITEPTHDEEYQIHRWKKFIEVPKQSNWVWEYFINRVGGSIKTTDQIYVETTLDNYVKTNERRKDRTGDVEPNVRFAD